MEYLLEIASAELETPRSDQAYNQIKKDILQGNIIPGGKLKLEVLQDTYGFSNTPLREALNRLAAEQLVVADERRGFRASPISLKDFWDLTRFRIVVENGAFADAIKHGNDEWEAGIVAAFHRMEAVNSRTVHDRSAWNDERTPRHKQFHMSLIAACTTNRLIATCSAMFDHAERYRRISWLNQHKPRDARKEHRRLMELALERNEAAAVALLRDHIMKTAERVSEILDGHEVALPASRQRAR